MLYLDTSFLVPLFLPEATSDRIERFLSRKHTAPLAKMISVNAYHAPGRGRSVSAPVTWVFLESAKADVLGET